MRSSLSPQGAILATAFLVAWWLTAEPAQAVEVTQLDVTGGSIALNLGTLGMVNGNISQSGTLFMGQFQEPNVFPPFTVSGHSFSLFTNPGIGPVPGEVPSGQVAGTGLSVDLRTLHAIIAGPQLNGALNIGGTATGSFDPFTRAFSLSFTHLYEVPTGVPLPLLGFGNISLQGTAALVPLPASLALFATGVTGLVGLARRRQGKPVLHPPHPSLSPSGRG